jgi:hypothetical protein
MESRNIFIGSGGGDTDKEAVESAITAGCAGVTCSEVSETLFSSDILRELSFLIKVRISFSGIRLSTEGRSRSRGNK